MAEMQCSCAWAWYMRGGGRVVNRTTYSVSIGSSFGDPFCDSHGVTGHRESATARDGLPAVAECSARLATRKTLLH